MIITQNGEAKATIIDIRKFEEMLETIVMLKHIAQGKKTWPQSVSDRLNISCVNLKAAFKRIKSDTAKGFHVQEAEHDLEGIFDYILGSGNSGAAKNMIRLIRQACESLSRMIERGHIHLSLIESTATSTGKLSLNPIL